MSLRVCAQSPKVQLLERYPAVWGFSLIMDIVGPCRTVNVTDTYIIQYLWVKFVNFTTTPSLSAEKWFSKDSHKLLKPNGVQSTHYYGNILASFHAH